eukprot:jgi/Bigna1/141154/aug1.60_g15862
MRKSQNAIAKSILSEVIKIEQDLYRLRAMLETEGKKIKDPNVIHQFLPKILDSTERMSRAAMDTHQDMAHFYGRFHSSGDDHGGAPPPTRKMPPGWEPTYHRSAGYDKKGEQWRLIKTGIDTARKYLGSYGELTIFIVGGKDTEANLKALRPMCGEKEHIIKMAESDQGDAYVCGAVDEGRGMVFCNTHKFAVHGFNDRKLQTPNYVSTRGIHEYFHVYQGCYLEESATWLEEGSAEFLAFYLGGCNKWNVLETFEKQMMFHMEEAQRWRKQNEGITIEHMEDIEKVAFAIGQSGKSVRHFYSEFCPLIKQRKSWKKALMEYTKLSSLQDFYFMFEMFMKMDAKEHRKVDPDFVEL